ncbi:AAA family ATPase [Streptomyces sp. AC495_CC817]|uniref:AAA family ATPase n=1 Tax=Streptomyces sp. AC495_CC817 TaxID=2823900 RepID=UPI001C27F614|nr:SMC family ATPase [Streptomyces sp. AC495_CC817]
MQLHRLEVEGFGPFRSRQSVDFDAFADDGIFLIAGRTGAGKSSILDAVCFGLYGGVPRYDGGEKRLRSDHSEPDEISEVVVEFSTVAGRFRVTRSPEYLRPAKRGGGMTKQAAAVALDEWTDAGWVGRAARAVDVGNELDEILQLSREQFLQVILLAQNRFSEFLLANSKDRQALLRRLFGTERFEDVQARFDERRRVAEQALGQRLAAVGARLDEAERLVSSENLLDEDAAEGQGQADVSEAPSSTDERLEALQLAAARAAYRSERRAAECDDAERRLSAADAAEVALRDDRRAQIERDRARSALDRLDAQAPQIDETRAELYAARSAEALRSTVSAAARAREALGAARLREEQAARAWRQHGVSIEGTSSDDGVAFEAQLEAWAEDRVRESGAWERARDLEAGAKALSDELAACAVRVETASARVDELEAERSELPALTATVSTARDAARRRADRVDDLRRARDAAVARRDAVAEAERLDRQQAEENRAVDAAASALAAAQVQFAQLRKRRSDGMSGELASALVDGAPCPVCGSAEHPAPAEHADPVSAEDVEHAEAERDAAARQERAAAEKLAATIAALAVARAAAGDRTAEQAEAEAEESESALSDGIAAMAETERLTEELETLAARVEHTDRQHAEAVAALAAAREQHAVLAQRSLDAEAQIAAARGEFATVEQRLSQLHELVESARALAAAAAETRRRASALEEAEEELRMALADSSFDDATGVEVALRSQAAQTELAARIEEHTVQRAKERAILLDLELRTLPEEPIDVAPVERAAAEARTLWTSAVETAARAAAAADRLTGLIESASAEHARTAADAAEFETLRGLADAISGRGGNTRKMTLETFVLAAELEEIVEAANRRLHDMSTGRYQLRHSDALAARGAASGLGIVVFDAFTGLTRPAQSLSGGETFLSSLALALGLAEVVTARAGGIRLDTLFIDEGFGSLDGDTLDIAMRTLDELRQGGRTVGVISHVEAMQEQIPAQVRVRATAEGPSVIETS